MAISDQTRKILWGKSGNKCALCQCELVTEGAGSTIDTIIGEECHIVAQSKRGPRASLITAEKMDEYENLILLCRNHHRIVDDQVENFPPEKLRKIKQQHEEWVKSQLSANGSKLSGVENPTIIKYQPTKPATQEITPSVNRSVAPDFHRMDAERFEEMSCALYQEELGISIADLYRRKYQGQYGIDIIAKRSDGTGKEVASCKCYSSIRKGNIAEWSDDFLKNWDCKWHDQHIKKFVLIVACLVNSAEREAEIDIEVARFQQYGIIYEVWGARQLQNKLRGYPGIVSQYLGEHWVSQICWMSQAALPPNQAVNDRGILSAEIISQFSSLQTELSGATNQLLDHTQEEIHQGNIGNAESRLSEIRSGQGWSQLLPDVKARVIRLQASLFLQRGDLHSAERLATEADSICSQKDPRLRALIAYRRLGAENGLVVLGTPTSQDGLHLRISMLLETGKIEEAVSILNNSPNLEADHVETIRLKAFASLLQGDRQKAYDTVQLAEKLMPFRHSVQRAGAMIRYALALSPVVPSEWFLYPNPIDLDLVRDDNKGRKLLAEALERFETLAGNEPDASRKQLNNTWILACSCNLRTSLDEAEQRCKQLLVEEPTHTGAIDWALARGFEFNREICRTALQALLNQGEGTFAHVISLTWLYLVDGQIHDASMTLSAYKDLFNTPSLCASYDAWLADLENRQTDLVTESDDPEINVSRVSKLIEQATISKDWTQIERIFARMVATSPLPAVTLKTAQSLAFAGQWGVLGNNCEVLLRFGTSEAVRLAVFAAYNTNHPDVALKILDENRAVFADGKIPHELRTLEINALKLSGKQSVARRHADILAAETFDIKDRLLKARLMIGDGDIAGSLPIIREAVRTRQLSPQEALTLSPVVALEDPHLAKALLQQSLPVLPKNYSVAAMNIASQIGLNIDSTNLFQQVGELAQYGSPFVKMVHVSEMEKYFQEWLESAQQLWSSYVKGVIPVHLYCARSNQNLAQLFSFHDPEKLRNRQPLLIRHGGRPSNYKLKTSIETWRIHLDITGLLIAGQLDLLDVIEQLPNPIIISQSLPGALIELEADLQSTKLVGGVPADTSSVKLLLSNVRSRMAQGIANGKYEYLPVAPLKGLDGDTPTETPPSAPLEKCLFDLLNAPHSEDTVLWFDDRSLSGYQNSNGSPIVGIYEVLNALSASSIITLADRDHSLCKLRSANALFIPLHIRELLLALSNAPIQPIQDGRVGETWELKAIRQNFANILLFEENLKLDESDNRLSGKPIEIQFLIEMQRLAAQIIIAQWKNANIDNKIRTARASWIWTALRIDRFNRLPHGITVFSSEYSALSIHIFSLLAGISQLPGRNVKSSQQRVADYIDWINNNVLDVRVLKDSKLQQSVTKYLSDLLLQIVKEAEKFGPEELVNCKHLLRILVDQYPDIIEKRLIDNEQFRKTLGIKVESVVNVDSLSFRADQFWSAIENAVARGHGKVRAIGQQRKQVVFKCSGIDKTTIKFSGDLKGGFSDSAIGLLSKTASARRKVLYANSFWLDMPLREQKAIIESIALEPSLAERMLLVEEHRNASATYLYSRLENQLKNHERLPFSAFNPPKVDVLLKHLRISKDSSKSLSERLSNAAIDLIQDMGWQVAFLRLAGFPINLPTPIINGYLAMTEGERLSALDSLEERAVTPLQMLQVLYLIGLHSGPEDKNIFQAYLDKLVEAWPTKAKAFISILRWTDSAFANDESWVCLSPDERLILAWIHADRLINVFVSQHVILDQVVPRFDANNSPRPLEQLLRLDADYEASTMHPSTIDDATLLYFGINHALRGNIAVTLLREEQIENIVGLLMVGEEGQRSLSPWLFLHRKSPSNLAGLMFTEYSGGLLNESMGVSEQNVQQLLENAVADLEANPNSPIHWKVVKLFVRGNISEQHREKVDFALKQVGLVDMVSNNVDDLGTLMIIGSCAASMGTDESRQHILDQLCAMAKHYSSKSSGEVPGFASKLENDGLAELRQLVEGIAALSRKQDFVEALGYFGDALVSLATEWPGAAPELFDVAENTIRQVHLEKAGNLWRSALTLRAIA